MIVREGKSPREPWNVYPACVYPTGADARKTTRQKKQQQETLLASPHTARRSLFNIPPEAGTSKKEI